MVSSALSGRQYLGGPPPVCKNPPERGPWPPPGAPAITLSAYANWTDLDPLSPYAQQGLITLNRVGPGNIYYGRSNPSDVRLELWVVQVGTTDYWDVTIWTFDPGGLGEEYTWPDVYVDPDKPFDTGVLLDMHVPGLDYRIALVAA